MNDDVKGVAIAIEIVFSLRRFAYAEYEIVTTKNRNRRRRCFAMSGGLSFFTR